VIGSAGTGNGIHMSFDKGDEHGISHLHPCRPFWSSATRHAYDKEVGGRRLEPQSHRMSIALVGARTGVRMDVGQPSRARGSARRLVNVPPSDRGLFG
jgi:hypothetical protein